MTIVGVLKFSRTVLINVNNKKDFSEIKSIIPLDIFLGISRLPFKISINMMLKICKIAIQSNSYKEAQDVLKNLLRISISDDQIRKIVNYIGKIVFNNDTRKTTEIIDQFSSNDIKYLKKDAILYIQTDGNFIRIRLNNSNETSWKENKTGICFSSENITTYINKHGELCHKILKREYISFFMSAAEFKPHLYALALRQGLGKYSITILLSDGAEWIKNFKKEYINEAVHILDFFHLLENCSTFLNYIYKNNKEIVDDRISNWKALLLESKYDNILNEISQYKNISLPDSVVNIYKYIEKNINMIDYKNYLEKGYFIGSGAIESTNKYLVQRRLKLSGMSWYMDNAQYVVSLRSKLLSDLWDIEVKLALKKFLDEPGNL